jgi:hypothetical protein
VLFGATVPAPVWTTAPVARLLAPARGSADPPGRGTPSDYRRAVAELMPLLPATSRDEVTTTADRLLSAIAELDSDIATLGDSAGSSEVDRLSAQLAALAEPSARASDERRELRELVQHQLELVQRMRARGELASHRRARIFGLLRGLWAQLGRVRDVSGDGLREPAVEQIRVLCTEIDLELTRR